MGSSQEDIDLRSHVSIGDYVQIAHIMGLCALVTVTVQ